MSVSETLKALNDPIRREILSALKQQSLCAGEIASRFSISQPAVSRHLAILRKADLIRDHHEGKFIRYELNASILDEVLLWLHDLKGETSDVLEKVPASDSHR